jgi:WD40 repeat protein
VTLWDAERGRLRAVLGDRDGPVSSLGIMPDGAHGYIVRDGLRVEFWDLNDPQQPRVLKGPFGPAFDFPDGDHLVIHDTARNAPIIWDPAQNRIREGSSPIHFMPQGLGFSPDGRFVVYCNSMYQETDQRVHLFDIDRLVRLPSPIRCPVQLLAITFDATGRTLAGGGEDDRVRLWDGVGGEDLLTLEGHSGPVPWVRFSPDGKTLASCAHRPDGTLEIFLWRTIEDEPGSAARGRTRP